MSSTDDWPSADLFRNDPLHRDNSPYDPGTALGIMKSFDDFRETSNSMKYAPSHAISLRELALVIFLGVIGATALSSLF